MILYDVDWTKKKLRIRFIFRKYQKTFRSKNYLQDCVTKMTMWCRRQVYFHQRLLSSSAGPMYNSSTPLTLEFQKNVQVAYQIMKNKYHLYFFHLINKKIAPIFVLLHFQKSSNLLIRLFGTTRLFETLEQADRWFKKGTKTYLRSN